MNDYQPKVPLKKLPKGISKMLTNFGAELRKEVHKESPPMTNATKERINQLRAFLQTRIDDLKVIEKEAKKAKRKLVTPVRMDLYLGPFYTDLLAVLDLYEKLLTEQKLSDKAWDIQRKKLEKATTQLKAEQISVNELSLALQDVEAELEKVRPLLGRKKVQPKIVCFCGSVRFSAEMMIWAWDAAKRGIIVLSWHVLPDGYFQGGNDEASIHGAEIEGVREIVDELHKRKIDLADEIWVVNVGGYIGDSTKSEVRYAHEHGKPIIWLEPDHADQNLRAALVLKEAKGADHD